MATPDGPADDIFEPGGRLRLDLLTEPAVTCLREALRLARATRWDSLRSPHVFMGLLAVPDPGVQNWGERLRADLPRLLGQFQELFHQEDGEEEPVLALNREFFSDNVLGVLRDAYGRAIDHGRSRIRPMDLLISVLTAANSIVADCFERIKIPREHLVELAVMAEEHTGS